MNAKATLVQFGKEQGRKYLENHLNPVMLVLIGLLMLNTIRWVPIGKVSVI